jgi:hypothetical protein
MDIFFVHFLKTQKSLGIKNGCFCFSIFQNTSLYENTGFLLYKM